MHSHLHSHIHVHALALALAYPRAMHALALALTYPRRTYSYHHPLHVHAQVGYKHWFQLQLGVVLIEHGLEVAREHKIARSALIVTSQFL